MVCEPYWVLSHKYSAHSLSCTNQSWCRGSAREIEASWILILRAHSEERIWSFKTFSACTSLGVSWKYWVSQKMSSGQKPEASIPTLSLGSLKQHNIIKIRTQTGRELGQSQSQMSYISFYYWDSPSQTLKIFQRKNCGSYSKIKGKNWAMYWVELKLSSI